VDIPARVWLERFALLVPGPAATRWLLMADLVCLVALGLAVRACRIAIPVALGVGFLALNVLAMLLNDFFLGLALFHLVVGATALLLCRPRWLGGTTLALAIALGVLT
jgi:Na+-translocating ferredoxin:NAD+ oxidoreductase RnfD subunit